MNSKDVVREGLPKNVCRVTVEGDKEVVYEGGITSVMLDRLASEKDTVLEVYMDGKKGLPFQVYAADGHLDLYAGQVYAGQAESCSDAIKLARRFYLEQAICFPGGLGKVLSQIYDLRSNKEEVFNKSQQGKEVHLMNSDARLSYNVEWWLIDKISQSPWHSFYYVVFDNPTCDWYFEYLEEKGVEYWKEPRYKNRYPISEELKKWGIRSI